jgi:hypothetical protein
VGKMKYGTYEWSAKGKRIISCSSRMHLWAAINSAAITVPQRRNLTKQERKDIIRSFPESTDGCRCVECRYFRIFGSKKYDSSTCEPKG